MARLFRLFLALVVALGLGLAVAPVQAQEITELPPSAAPRLGEAITAPRDMPALHPSARDSIPPVPVSYVTRELGWLTISYPAPAAERVAPLIESADSFKAELEQALGQKVLERLEVRVAPTVADMARLAPAAAPPPAYASGVAYGGLHFVLLSMLAPRGADAVDLEEVFRHELVHVALEDAVGGRHVPVWFNEGLAIQLSGERVMDRMGTMWNATLSGTLIPISDLDRSFPVDPHEVNIAYAESADFMRFLSRRADRARFAAMIDRVREGEAFDRSIAQAYGSDLRKLEFQWRSEAERRYSLWPVLAGGGLVWIAVMAALVVAYVKRRRRTRAILARWEREEAIEDAIVARRAAAETAENDDAVIPTAGARTPSVKIEHAGRIHTLH